MVKRSNNHVTMAISLILSMVCGLYLGLDYMSMVLPKTMGVGSGLAYPTSPLAMTPPLIRTNFFLHIARRISC